MDNGPEQPGEAAANRTEPPTQPTEMSGETAQPLRRYNAQTARAAAEAADTQIRRYADTQNRDRRRNKKQEQEEEGVDDEEVASLIWRNPKQALETGNRANSEISERE